MSPVSPELRQRARELRQSLTEAEIKLWGKLRNRQLRGLKFRRQHPIGSFIADFYCAEHRLVIEIDGKYHQSQIGYDEYRTKWLIDHGYQVIRFSNDEVIEQVDQVVAKILDSCAR